MFSLIRENNMQQLETYEFHSGFDDFPNTLVLEVWLLGTGQVQVINALRHLS